MPRAHNNGKRQLLGRHGLAPNRRSALTGRCRIALENVADGEDPSADRRPSRGSHLWSKSRSAATLVTSPPEIESVSVPSHQGSKAAPTEPSRL